MQLLENRAYIDRREREHQKEIDKHEADMERQLRQHSDFIGETIKEGMEKNCSFRHVSSQRLLKFKTFQHKKLAQKISVFNIQKLPR